MARNLDLATLRSFIAVADCGGVTRAAQRLHLTQSAVSMQIKRLEESLDVELLSRGGRRVTLTRRGEELLAHARRLIALNDEVWEAMTAPDCAGDVRLGAPHDIVYPNVPTILRRFNEDHSAVRVTLISAVTEILFEKLDAGEVDVILTTEFGVRDGGEVLQTLPLVWVGAVGGRAWRRTPVPIAFERRCAFRKQTQRALEETGRGWEWAVDTEYLDAAFATVAADLGVTTLLRGVHPPSMGEIDHGGELPALPELNINMYQAGGLNEELAARLATYVRAVYAEAGRKLDGPRHAA